MSSIQPFQPTGGVAKAVFSIGDDIAKLERDDQRQDSNMRLMEEKLRSNEKIAEARLNAKLQELDAKYGTGAVEARVSAYRRDMGVDETPKAEDDPAFQEAGPTEDGRPIINRDKRQAYTEDQRERGLAARVLATSPKDYNTFQKGQTEGMRRSKTLGAPSMDAALEGGRRVNAYQGDPEFDIDEGTKLNKFTGSTDTTEVGRSTIGKNQAHARKFGADAGAATALAEKRRADAGKGGSGTPLSEKEQERLRKERATLQNVITQSENTIREYQKNSAFLRRAQKDPNGPEAAKMKALEDRIKEAKAGIARLNSQGGGAAKPGGAKRLQFNSAGELISSAGDGGMTVASSNDDDEDEA